MLSFYSGQRLQQIVFLMYLLAGMISIKHTQNENQIVSEIAYQHITLAILS